MNKDEILENHRLPEDLSCITRDDLIEIRDSLVISKKEIILQIQNYNGENKEWLHRAHLAVAYRKRAWHRINHELANRKRAIKRANKEQARLDKERADAARKTTEGQRRMVLEKFTTMAFERLAALGEDPKELFTRARHEVENEINSH